MRNAQIGRSEMPLAPGPIATRTWLAKDTSTQEATELHEEAVAHAKCRRWDLALEQALRAVHLDSGDPEFEATYAWVLYQAGPPRRETDAQIAAHLNRALKLDRECARAHYVLGLLRKRQDKHEAAEVHFRRALDSDPDHVEAEREMRLYSRRRASRPKSGVVQRVVETLTGKRERGSFRPDGDD